MGVADLLSASLAAHAQSMPRKGQARDVTALQRAYDLRVEALELDPGMSNPAWTNGKASHASLMAFYAEVLGRSPEQLARMASRNQRRA